MTKTTAAARQATLTMTMTPDAKALIEAEAEHRGTSVSKLMERLLSKAIDEGRMAALLGSDGSGAALRKMADFAALVHSEIGDPETDYAAKLTLQEGWNAFIWRALPFTPSSPLAVAAGEAHSAAWDRTDGFLNAALQMMADWSNPQSEALRSWLLGTRVVSDQPTPGSQFQAGSASTGTGFVPLLLTLGEYARGKPLSATVTGGIVAALNEAPAAAKALSPSPGDVAKAIVAATEAQALYNEQRQDALTKGQALVQRFMPPR